MSAAPPLHLLNEGLEEAAQTFVACGILAAPDLLVVDAVAPRFDESDPEVLLGLAFAVRAPRAGHVGVDLQRIRERADDEQALRLAGPALPAEDTTPAWPQDPAAWQARVLRSRMVGRPSDTGIPFVRQELMTGATLIMTRRMWREQERLSVAVAELAAGLPGHVVSDEALSSGVRGMFDGADSQGARAVITAARRRLTIVTGGPGTGKTYSIKRLLALLLQATPAAAAPLRIELAAPTGKAAVRMAEAIAEDLDRLTVSADVRRALTTLRPRTLHKLLGMRPDGTSRHGRDKPVAADLVVVDEASMVDLSLMRRLFEAIPAGSRLVLLGDRDQLASVEAGTVLADMVGPVLDGTGGRDEPLHAAVVPFAENYRSRDAPTVAAVARALQRRGDEELDQVARWMSGDEVAAGEHLRDRITHLGVPTEGRPASEQLAALAAPYLADAGFIGVLAAAIRAHGPTSSSLQASALHLELFRALEGYRVLAVHRRGPLGVSGLERALAALCQRSLLGAIAQRAGAPEDAPVKLPSRSGYWLGQPLLVTENSYEVGLMNGDIGLVLQTATGLAAVFPAPKDGADSTREVALARLPSRMGAFAMTVHKSQGSQFRRVAVVLAGRDSPIQTRELVYTAITRTSDRLDWLGDPAELRRALERRVGRASGLGDLLWRT